MVTTSSEVVSLYFHIPFCTKKCPYCHFYVVPNQEDLHSALSQGLQREWQAKLPLLQNKRIASIYFGGGTPSLFAPDGIALLLKLTGSLALLEDCEITIEANPEEISQQLLVELHDMGINRLSLGVQSLDDGSLQVLERRHTAKRAKEAIYAAASAGFQNISIDLMMDLPWQTEESWRSTLVQLNELPITHLSLYNLTIEPHTSFHLRRKQLEKVVPDQVLSVQLLTMGIEAIEEAGLKRYEISAFAKEGYASRHNVGYWTGRPFLGYGPSAFSYWDKKRFRNMAHLLRYRRALVQGDSSIDFEEQLPHTAHLKELLAVRLRLLEGVATKSWDLPAETLATLDRLQTQGLLDYASGIWKLSPRGLLLYDSVAAEIIE